MEADKILDLLQFLILLAQFLQEHPAIDLLLQLVHVTFIVVDYASLVQKVVGHVQETVDIERRLMRHDVVKTGLECWLLGLWVEEGFLLLDLHHSVWRPR